MPTEQLALFATFASIEIFILTGHKCLRIWEFTVSELTCDERPLSGQDGELLMPTFVPQSTRVLNWSVEDPAYWQAMRGKQ